MYSQRDLAVIGQEVIRQCQFLCLATASAEGQPWASPVMFFADEHYRLHWVSAVDAVHSQNIRATGHVSVAIYDSRPIPGKAQAVYGQGMAVEAGGDDLDQAFQFFFGMRFPEPQERARNVSGPGEFTGDAPRRIYVATISQFSVLNPHKKVVGSAVLDDRVGISFD